MFKPQVLFPSTRSCPFLHLHAMSASPILLQSATRLRSTTRVRPARAFRRTAALRPRAALLHGSRAHHKSAALLGHNDLRQTPLYQSFVHHFQSLLEPGLGSVSDATEPAGCSNRSLIAFTGSVRLSLDANPTQHIHIADTVTETLVSILHGVNNARSPQWSPDGRRLAYLNDCAESGIYQAYIVDITDPSSPSKPEDIASLPGTAEAVLGALTDHSCWSGWPN